MIEMEEVIREVAIQNGHGLQRDDPVLFLVTVMNCIAKGYDDQNAALVTQYGKLLEEYRESHQEAALQWRNDAKGVATSVLNAGLTAGRDAAAKLMSEGAAKVIAMVKEEFGRQTGQMEMQLEAYQEENRRMRKYLTWMAGGITVVLLLAVSMAIFTL